MAHWHAKARYASVELRWSTRRIAALCGVSQTAVQRFLDPAYAKRQRDAENERQRRRWKADEAFRERKYRSRTLRKHGASS